YVFASCIEHVPQIRLSELSTRERWNLFARQFFVKQEESWEPGLAAAVGDLSRGCDAARRRIPSIRRRVSRTGAARQDAQGPGPHARNGACLDRAGRKSRQNRKRRAERIGSALEAPRVEQTRLRRGPLLRYPEFLQESQCSRPSRISSSRRPAPARRWA